MKFKIQYDGSFMTYYISDCGKYYIFKRARGHYILAERVGMHFPIDRKVECRTLTLAKQIAHSRRIYGTET